MRTSYRQRLAGAIAAAFLSDGPWTRAALVKRAAQALGERRRWLTELSARVLARYEVPPRDDLRPFARVIACDPALASALAGRADPPRVRGWPTTTVAMRETPWHVPPIATPGELAAWLGTSSGELAWFADARGLERIAGEPLRHYTYRWVTKRTGGVRLLEAPKARTKAIQRRILHEILERIPPHDAAHGFRRGRSVRTHAGPHAGRAVVLRIDLADFFLSVSAARVTAVFGRAGYPREAAYTLALLCTNRAPVDEAAARAALGRYASRADVEAWRRAQALARTRHLPQGAPTSPALANLCAYALDVRLSAAAHEAGAVYTRYADDLVFSGDADFERRARRFAVLVGGIALDEGFVVNHRKTRLMGRGGRQSVGGLVVNERPRAPREAFDTVKAILHNCERHGAASQNRDGRDDFHAYVRGLVSWVAAEDPRRGARLWAAFARISWS